MIRQSKVYSISDDDFKLLVSQSFSYSEILRRLNLKTKGGSSTDVLKQRIRDLDCDISHFLVKTKNLSFQERIPINDILVENSNYANTSYLKKRILDERLLEYKCQECGNNGVWNNKKLKLHLDHINGINNDHRIGNLRFLCPNCHSQTPTYSGKNKKQG